MIKKLNNIPTLDDIQKVHEGIKSVIHQTPVQTCQRLNEMTGAFLFFKCENFQKVGAFKMRGAASALLSMTEEEKQKGIATHSSGNHAQAVALNAKLHGIKAYIVMPKNSPKIKKQATAGYGAEIIFSENTIESRAATLAKVIEQTGANFIHPFDDYNIIAGQATAAKELIEEVGALDIVMAPIGGGGLMCGTALITHYLLPDAKIIGAEPKEVDDAFRSMQSGKIEKNATIHTLADGLRTNLSEKTFEIIRGQVDEIITVSEKEMIQAMRLIWERMKIIIEPSSAVPFAAVLQQKEKFAGKQVGIILTGGNVDLEKLPFTSSALLA